jgi:hypothetical protein
MRIPEWLSNLVSRNKEIHATPELLAGALNLMVMKHLDSLLTLFKEDRISTTETQINQLLSELLCFYYSLSSFRLAQCLTSDADINLYGAELLKQARRLLSASDLADSLKHWIRDDSLFLTDFDSSFLFYYHNTIPQTERESFERVAQLCHADKSNSIIYLAAKLQFRISNLLRITPTDRSFIPLWIRQSTTVIGFSKTLYETKPVLH